MTGRLQHILAESAASQPWIAADQRFGRHAAPITEFGAETHIFPSAIDRHDSCGGSVTHRGVRRTVGRRCHQMTTKAISV